MSTKQGHSQKTQPIKLTLENIRELLEILNNPHLKLKTIHVAGTNGKGSVCAYLSSVLFHAGYKTGRYTSPHLITPRDSIVVNERIMSEQDWNYVKEVVENAAKQCTKTPSLFEIQTAMAFWYFEKIKVDIAVIEVGMGGLLDATNVIENPLLCVITSISYDHREYLGNTLEEIAFHKAGIMKNNCDVVSCPQVDAVLNVLAQQAFLKHCNLVWAERSKPLVDEWAIAEPSKFKYRSPLLKGLSEYQLENSGLAMTALRILREKGIKLSDEAILKGFENTKWPGRVQWVNVPQLKNYSILVDGAHNTGGAAQLRKYIDNFLNAHWSVQKVIFLFGASASKDLRGILRLLLQPDDELFALPFSTPERMPWVHSYKTSDIVATVKSLFPHFSCLEFDSFKSVFAFIAERFLQLNAPVPNSQTVNPLPNVLIVLCGSLYLLADFYRYLGDDAKPYLWEEFGPVLAADNKTHKIQE